MNAPLISIHALSESAPALLPAFEVLTNEIKGLALNMQLHKKVGVQ